MKQLIHPNLLKRLGLAFLSLIFLAATQDVARAGLTFTIDLYRTSQGTFYVFYTPVNTNGIGSPPAAGTYIFTSPGWPTNGSRRAYQMVTNVWSDRYDLDSEHGYGDFNSVITEITNGPWTIQFTNATTTNFYKFNVTGTGALNSNLIPVSTIIFPSNGSQITPIQTNFAFSGPTNWLVSGDSYTYNNDSSYFQYFPISPSATNLSLPGPFPAGTNWYFQFNFATNYVVNVLNASTPVLSNSVTTLSGWLATNRFETGSSLQFNVFNPGAPSSGHTNIVWYTFEDNTLFTHDYSESGNDVSGYGNYAVSPFITNDAKAGLYAFGANNDGWLNPPTNSILPALARSFSVSVWYKSTQATGNDTDDQYAARGIVSDFSGNQTQSAMPMGATGSKLAFYTGGFPENLLHSQASINTGQYVHLVTTRDQQTGDKRIYINGALDSSVYGSTDVLDGGDNFWIGYNWGNPIKASMDEIQVYSGVLSATEVAYIYNHPGSAISNSAAASPFNFALNTSNLNWSTSGDTSWFVESTNTYDGVSAARSGSVTNTQTSSLSATITGPGTLSFYWSSFAQDPAFGWDYEFDIDGAYQNDIYGDTSWVQAGPYSIASGTHTLTWVVNANGDTDPTQAGYLDQVLFTPASALPPVITLSPFNQTNYPGYSVALISAATSATNAPVTWQWFKVGSLTPISGATNPLYIPANAGTAGVAGSYYAVASNAYGSATSGTGVVSFVSAPLPPDWSRAFKSPFFNSNNLAADYYVGTFSDSSGNLYAAGQSAGSNYIGTTPYVSQSLTNYMATIVKQSSSGAALWAAAVTNRGTGYSYAQSVAPAPGNGAYLGGFYNGTNWLGTNLLVNNGGGGIFIARFDSTGKPVWVRSISCPTNFVFQIYNAIATDPSGNLITYGLISGLTSFTTTNGAVGTNILATGQQGVLARYDSNGAFQWAQITPGLFENVQYSAGRIYGAFSSPSTNFTYGTVNVSTDRGWVIAAVNATNGFPLWVQGIGEPYGSGNPLGYVLDFPSISVAGSNIFAAGISYSTNAKFGAFTTSWSGSNGQYFARCDTNGNPQLITSFGSPNTLVWAVVADTNGNVYVGGDFDRYTAFGSDILAAPHLDSIGDPYASDGFVAKFDRNGNSIWARPALTQSGLVNIRGLTIAPDGLWACGFFKSPASFGTNLVYSGSACIGTPICNITNFTSGVLARITEGAIPVTLLNPTNSGANFEFSFISQQGFSHSILYRTNLILGSWQTNSTITGNGSLTNITLPISIFNGSKQGYVRVSTQ